MKILPVRAELFMRGDIHTDGRTDTQTDRQTDRYEDANSRFSRFCERAENLCILPTECTNFLRIMFITNTLYFPIATVLADQQL